MVDKCDSPVSPSKEILHQERIKIIEIGKELDLKGINVGMITLEKQTEVLKQINYRLGDCFYKIASQRLMVYVEDDSTPSGMKTLHNDLNSIPLEWKNNELKDRTKKEFVFKRSDLYL